MIKASIPMTARNSAPIGVKSAMRTNNNPPIPAIVHIGWFMTVIFYHTRNSV